MERVGIFFYWKFLLETSPISTGSTVYFRLVYGAVVQLLPLSNIDLHHVRFVGIENIKIDDQQAIIP